MNSNLTHKFVAVLNKKIPVNLLMNALGHMAVGLGASFDEKDLLRLDTYVDADRGKHKHISDNPFIVLRADNSNKIRTLRNACIENGIHFADFTSTMTVGTYKEQKERTQQTPEASLEYYGLAMFGEIHTLNKLTKKFSLWR